MRYRFLLYSAAMLTIGCLEGPAVLAQSLPAASEPLHLETHIWYTSTGEICRASIGLRGTDRNSSWLFRGKAQEIIDLLAPPSDRGRRLLPDPDFNYLGNCRNESNEQYERVAIYFGTSSCGPPSIGNGVMIFWKGRTCVPSRQEPRPCDGFLAVMKPPLVDLESIISSTEKEAAQEQNEKMKNLAVRLRGRLREMQYQVQRVENPTPVIPAFKPRTAAVCSNGHPSVQAEYAASQAVVVAKVLNSASVYGQDGYPDETHYEVLIQKKYKGGNPSNTVQLFRENSSARIPMVVGREYLLFLTRDPDHLERQRRYDPSGYQRNFELLKLDECGNSGELSQSSNVIKEVEKLAASTGTPR